MENKQIESNTTDIYLGKEIVGFSGYTTKKTRKRLIAAGKLARIKYLDLSILVFYNPVVADFHLPQDAVGVFPFADFVTFGIADGVSIVGQKIQNDSGELAHQLIMELPELNPTKWQTNLASLCASFQKTGKSGASTIFWGQLEKKDSIWLLDTLQVSEAFDFGMSYLISPSSSINFPNESQGFVPYPYTPHEQQFELEESFDLVISSDGALLPKGDLHDLIKLHREEPDLKKISLFLEREIEPQKDDQSLIVISR